MKRASPSPDSPPSPTRRSRPPADRDPLRRPPPSPATLSPRLRCRRPVRHAPQVGQAPEDGAFLADIAAEAAHFKSYAGKRNCYAWDEATWFTLAEHSTRSVPIPKEAIAKAATELSMLFPFAFGADEEKALVNLVKAGAWTRCPRSTRRTRSFAPWGCPCRTKQEDRKTKDLVRKGLTPTPKAGRLGVPFEVDIPRIPGGTPDSDDDEE